jgi:hypothetical protein
MATAWSPAERKPLRASPTEDPAITVFLADDNLLVREGVRALLGLEPDLQVIGTAAGPTPRFLPVWPASIPEGWGPSSRRVSAQKGWP